MKKRLIKIGILTAVFLIALVVSSLIINRGNDDEIVDMGAPALPRVSFVVADQDVNMLFGYVNDMDITAMRDTVTPLESSGLLTLKLEKNGNAVSRIGYEIYSLDGKEKYGEGEVKDSGSEDGIALSLGKELDESVREAVLKVVLTVAGDEKGSGKDGTKTVSYFTRIVKPEETTAAKCLEFAKDFHDKALDKSAPDELNSYLEPGDESDNTTYQTVNIHSDVTHIQWGELAPQIIGEVRWSIKESNSVYTSLLAKYRVSCVDDDGETALFNVKEFFRVRIAGDTVYLLDYNRDMQEVFSPDGSVLDDDGVKLGIGSEDIQYETNKDESMVAFVKERELWLYNVKTGEFSRIFGFSDQAGTDERSRNDQHEVRIVSMDNGGDLAFAVYGYMNRGEHEGEVGVGVYYFDIKGNVIEEKAFIPSTKSFAIAEDELGKMVYYNHDEETLYVLAAGTLYQVDLEKDKQTVLAEGLTESQYAVSDDGHLMAYQTEGEDGAEKQIQVLNLKNGKNYTVKADEGETVRPLGFVNGDFIYGKQRADDAGTTASGEEITPMYELEIRDSDNKTVAEYTFEEDNIYTTDILIDTNLVTLNRVLKSGDSYRVTSHEFITNNEERKDTKLELSVYSTGRLEKQLRFTFEDGVGTKEVRVLKPNQLVSGKPLTITLSGNSEGVKYYVYGVGELAGIYDKAVYAIQKAEQISGVVISSEQAYVWEKGNRDLAYSTEASAFKKQGEESALEACERYMEEYGAKKTDLTGCTLEQVLYVINKGCPVIAVTGGEQAVLLTGYTKTDVTYIDPENGSEKTVSVNEMEDMVEGNGNTFIGYIK